MKAFIFRQIAGTPHPLVNTGHSRGKQGMGDFVTALPLYLRPPCSSTICHWHHQGRESEFHFTGGQCSLEWLTKVLLPAACPPAPTAPDG